MPKFLPCKAGNQQSQINFFVLFCFLFFVYCISQERTGYSSKKLKFSAFEVLM